MAQPWSSKNVEDLNLVKMVDSFRKGAKHQKKSCVQTLENPYNAASIIEDPSTTP